jgi:exodeoxyribonuclease VII small subunit
MKTNLTYKKAYSELEKIVEEIEEEDIQLETLANKVKDANELIKFCEDKLRTIETEVNEVISEKPTAKKKKINR